MLPLLNSSTWDLGNLPESEILTSTLFFRIPSKCHSHSHGFNHT